MFNSGKGAPVFAFALALAGSLALTGCGENYHNDAERQFLKAARKGDAEAQYNLGACYEFGGVAPKDAELARRWYEKAAKQGHKKAQARLRILNAPKAPSAEDARFLSGAARKGDPEALYKCAECFEFGFFTAKDRDWALRLYAQAAKKGNAQAPERVQALTDELTPAEAEVKRFRDAARKGDAEAQYQYARCLEFGFHVKQNLAAAQNLYRRAAARGHKKAQARLNPWRITVPRSRPAASKTTKKPSAPGKKR